MGSMSISSKMFFMGGIVSTSRIFHLVADLIRMYGIDGEERVLYCQNGYRALQLEMHDAREEIRKKLWNLHIPSNVKHFMWRTIMGVVEKA